MYRDVEVIGLSDEELPATTAGNGLSLLPSESAVGRKMLAVVVNGTNDGNDVDAAALN
jgi:hypothetical protein